MAAFEADRGPSGSLDAWNGMISQWVSQLSPAEQKVLCAQWLLRKRRDAMACLRQFFSPEFTSAFQCKIEQLRRKLGGVFMREENLLLSTLYLYIASMIPESIRDETKRLVQAALTGKPIIRA